MQHFIFMASAVVWNSSNRRPPRWSEAVRMSVGMPDGVTRKTGRMMKWGMLDGQMVYQITLENTKQKIVVHSNRCRMIDWLDVEPVASAASSAPSAVNLAPAAGSDPPAAASGNPISMPPPPPRA